MAESDATRYPPTYRPSEVCDVRMDDFFNGPRTFCGRPSGHAGPHWPIAMAADRPADGR